MDHSSNSEGHFSGRWPYIDDALFSIPEQRATRAFIELALLYRILDDQEKLDDGSIDAPFGKLFNKDGSATFLDMRNISNKTIHAQKLEWIFTNPTEPILKAIADPNAKEKWVHAEININHFAAGCGTLMG